jgi:uncharacterized damage-inducible protein DinB
MSDTRDVRTLQDLYAYNAWANAQVFAVCRDRDQAQLDASAPGTIGTITATLAHLVGVEAVYLLMLRGELDALQRFREQSAAFSLGAWAQRAARLGAEYRELLASADAAFYDEPLAVPWFDFALTKHDGLLQVLSHSAQHRAQVFSVLGERGVEVPDLDYVLYVKSKAGSAGSPPTADGSQQ